MLNPYLEFLSCFFWEIRNKKGKKTARPNFIAVGAIKNRFGHSSSMPWRNGYFPGIVCIFLKKRRENSAKKNPRKNPIIPKKRVIYRFCVFFDEAILKKEKKRLCYVYVTLYNKLEKSKIKKTDSWFFNQNWIWSRKITHIRTTDFNIYCFSCLYPLFSLDRTALYRW